MPTQTELNLQFLLSTAYLFLGDFWLMGAFWFVLAGVQQSCFWYIKDQRKKYTQEKK